MKQGSEMSRLVLMGGSTPLQPFKTGCDASADVPAVFTRSSLNGECSCVLCPHVSRLCLCNAPLSSFWA